MDEENADAVDAQVIVDRGRGKPLMENFQLVTASARRDGPDGKERQEEFHDANKQADAANPQMVFLAQQHNRKDANEREEKQDGEQVSADGH